jgi:GNAT superfamily N-acetyltransferase
MDEAIVIVCERPDTPDAQALTQRLDAELYQRYPGNSVHGFKPGEAGNFQGIFVIARCAGKPVGCGAVRLLEPGVGEIKRMFVDPQCRGRGIARQILGQLEAAAQEVGCHVLRLETGPRQPEAIKLYESSSYLPIPRFGEYVDDPLSMCFEKRLPSGAATVPARCEP